MFTRDEIFDRIDLGYVDRRQLKLIILGLQSILPRTAELDYLTKSFLILERGN